MIPFNLAGQFLLVGIGGHFLVPEKAGLLVGK